MRNYFLSVQLHSREFHKFVAGIVRANLDNDKLPDLAKKLILSEYKNIDVNALTIQVIAFNNID